MHPHGRQAKLFIKSGESIAKMAEKEIFFLFWIASRHAMLAAAMTRCEHV
jgi:hypothetical protein